MSCPWWSELGRTARPRSDARLQAHLESCAACAAALRLCEDAAAAIKAVPYQAPDHGAREHARTRLMASLHAGHRPLTASPRRLGMRGAVTVAVTLCGASVLAAVGTRVFQERPAVQAPARDVIRPPRVRSAVAKAPPRPDVAMGPPLLPRVPRPGPPRKVAMVAPAAPIAGPAEVAFNQGWEALRAGDHLAAAEHLERAVALLPDGTLEEDARYWRAVALGRAGAADQARTAMEQFLRLHPGSPRAGAMAAMLGWLLVDAGEPARAHELFLRAAGDASATVRDSARAGLEVAP